MFRNRLKDLKKFAQWLFGEGIPIDGEIVEIKKDIMEEDTRLSVLGPQTAVTKYRLTRRIYASLKQETGDVVDIILENDINFGDSAPSHQEVRIAETILREPKYVLGMKISGYSYSRKSPYRIPYCCGTLILNWKRGDEQRL